MSYSRAATFNGKSDIPAVSYRSIDADGIEVSYQDAGPRFEFTEVTHPEQIAGIVSQNGDAYEEGLGDAWQPVVDYTSNVILYPKFQAYFHEAKPNLLAGWGRDDPFFVPAGAEAFRRDIPESNIQSVNAGHFALQTDVHAIALAILEVVPAFFG